MVTEATPLGSRQFRRFQHLALEGQPQNTIYRIEDGWAARYQLLSDDRRQITALFVPGEYCEPQWILGERASQPIVAMTNLRVRPIPIEELREGPTSSADDIRAMLAAVLKSLNRQIDWTVRLGRKTATERVCGLICEIYDRMCANNRIMNNRCPLPLTQYEMADIVGLTPIHLNRVLQSLRRNDLIELRAKSLRIPDLAALRRIAEAPSPAVERASALARAG
jgi:CRP-like cAMP-binding protein